MTVDDGSAKNAGKALPIHDVATILFVRQSFAIALIYYVPAAAFLLISFLLVHFRRRKNYLVAGIADLALSFAAAALQRSEVAIASLGLNHHALYHLVQAAALVLILSAAQELSREV